MFVICQKKWNSRPNIYLLKNRLNFIYKNFKIPCLLGFYVEICSKFNFAKNLLRKK